MADMDPELAFLESQKEYDPAGNYSAVAGEQPDEEEEEEEEEEEAEYDPAAAFAPYPPLHEMQAQAQQHAHSPSEQSASMPESAANTPSPAEAADLKAQPQPSKQPRTMGGFVVESEDEDEAPEPEAKTEAAGAAMPDANGVSQSPQQALSHSPSNTLAPQNVPVHSAQSLGPPVSSNVAVNDAASVQSSAVPNQGTPVPSATPVPQSQNTAEQGPSAAPATSALPKQRLPQDHVGLLEDRIAEDPRGDIEAWLSLIGEHRRRHKIDDARSVYDRFFKIFPTAAEQWNAYINMELEFEELNNVERLFERSIASNPHVGFWSTYINYIRRIHNISVTPQAREVVNSVYKFVLDNIGIDISSGKIWLDYIEFLKTGPGVLGGKNWEDMQKMDVLRATYQRAISIPTNATLDIWREYDKFELTLNKATGRKNLQEKSPYYMTARSAKNVLENVTRGVIRTTLPKLPPVQGFHGHDEYMNQVKLWKNWIEWEKSDPLELKEESRASYNARVVYLYKQALMALRFWPELWYEAAEWCFTNDLETQGNEFLTQGIDANPESCLLAFRHAHQIELKGTFEDGEAGILRKGEAVRAPFDRVLGELYDLTNKLKKREEQAIARTKENFAAQQAAEEAARANAGRDSDDEDADEEAADARRRKEKEEALQAQLQSISAGYDAQMKTLKKILTYAWIALMRAMRRIQGKGRPDPPAGTPAGFRGIFAEARRKGKLLSDAYVVNALIEHHCYQDPAATRIFDRGMKLFPDDEIFALEYIKHLVKQNDTTNARAVFETVVNRLSTKPGGPQRTKPLFAFFHEYESQYGDLAQIVKLEKRMNELFPEDPQLARFAERFSSQTFDPTTVRPVISIKTQMQPVMLNVVPTVEEPQAPPPQVQQEFRPSPPALNSPRMPQALLPVVNSPKRAYDDTDNELAQPRKMARGESPLKGAAGRRLDAARRNQQRASESGFNMPVAPVPAPLPRELTFLLSIIPSLKHYEEEKIAHFNPHKLASVFAATQLPTSLPMPVQQPQAAPVAQPPPPQAHVWGQPPPPMGGYNVNYR